MSEMVMEGYEPYIPQVGDVVTIRASAEFRCPGCDVVVGQRYHGSKGTVMKVWDVTLPALLHCRKCDLIYANRYSGRFARLQLSDGVFRTMPCWNLEPESP